MMRAIIAVDPGKSGGYAISINGAIEAHPYRDETEFLEHVHELIERPDLTVIEAAVEEVPKFIGRNIPGSTTFVLGYHYGWIVGALRALAIPVHLYRPQVWQKGLSGVREAKGAKKKRVLRDHATRLFPSLKPTMATADAILILRHHLNQ